MTRKQFDQLVADAVASLPPAYRALLDNVAILVEDFPAAQGPVGAGLQLVPLVPLAPSGGEGSGGEGTAPSPSGDADEDDLLMGEFIGVPRTERALWDMPPEPARVVLYQKNIEAYAADCAEDDPSGPTVEEIIREEVRLTVLHELGHFFGMEEDQLEDV